jgi:hypothetical protein
MAMDEKTREEVEESLINLADQPEWNPEAWQRCHQLVEANSENELLRYVYDDLIHYSGVFHSHNLLGFSVKPDKAELEHYRQEFREIAAALRNDLSLAEAKQKYEL